MARIKVHGETEQAVLFWAGFNEFKTAHMHHNEGWKDAYFLLLSWKNTLSSRFYSVDITSTRTDARVEVLAPKEHADYVRGLLNECGYVNIAEEEVTVAVLSPYEVEDENGKEEHADYVVYEW